MEAGSLRDGLINNLTTHILCPQAVNTTCTMSLRNATLIQFFQAVSRVVASRNVFTSLTPTESAPIGSTFLRLTTSARQFPGERNCLCRISAFPPRCRRARPLSDRCWAIWAARSCTVARHTAVRISSHPSFTGYKQVVDNKCCVWLHGAEEG